MKRSPAVRAEFGGGHDRFGAMRAWHADGVNAIGDLLGATACDAVKAAQEQDGGIDDRGEQGDPEKGNHGLRSFLKEEESLHEYGWVD